MSEIGNTTVAIKANSTQFDMAVTMAMNRFKAFESVVSGFKTGDIAGGTRGLMDLGKTLAGNFNASSLFAALGSMPGWIGVAGQAADYLRKGIGALNSEMQALAHEGISNISSQMRLARMFHISTEAASAFQTVAHMIGVDSQVMQDGMARVARSIGDARAGSVEARAHFEAMGLDWRELASIPLDQSILQINNRLAAMTNITEQAHTAQQIYGRGWREQLQFIQRSNELMERAVQLDEDFGASATQTQVERVRALRNAERQLHATQEAARAGIVNRIGSAAAPFMTAFAEMWTRAIESAQPLLAWIRDILDLIAERGQHFLTGWRNAWERIQPIVERIVEKFMRFITGIGDALGLTTDLGDTSEGIENTLVAMAEAWERIVDASEPFRDAIVSIFSTARDITLFMMEAQAALLRMTLQTESADRVEAAAARLRSAGSPEAIAARAEERAFWRELETFARGVAEIETARLERRRIAHEEELREFDRIWAMHEEGAARVLEALESPLAKFREQIENINIWEEMGLLDSEEAARAMLKATEDFDKAMGGRKERQFAGVMEAGSAAAVSAINRFQFGNGPESPEERVARLLEEAARRDAEALDVSRDIRRAIERIAVPAFADLGAA
jgi:hypothetical protein